jgi:hypothetical protein
VVNTKLIKLLMLTTSDNDNEALSAIRMANKLLKSKNITWECAFSEKVTTHEPNSNKSDYFEQALSMCNQIIEHKPPWFDDTFVRSLLNQLINKGRLSDKQFTALQKIHHKIFNF